MKRITLRGLDWEVSAQNGGYVRLRPIDPLTGKVASLVLTRDGKPIEDPSAWLKRHNDAQWAKAHGGTYLFSEVLDEYAEAHGGACRFEWHRAVHLPATSDLLKEKV